MHACAHSEAFEAFSCSIICLLQLEPESALRTEQQILEYLLPAWKKDMWFWHFVTVLPLGADPPEDRCDSKDNKTHDRSVGLPIMRLRVPATGRRPDMFGISARRSLASVQREPYSGKEMERTEPCLHLPSWSVSRMMPVVGSPRKVNRFPGEVPTGGKFGDVVEAPPWKQASL